MALSPKFANATVSAEADALARLLDNGYLRICAGEPTQAASSLSGDLTTGAASGSTIAGAITQAAGVIAGTLQRSGSVQQPSGASKPLFFRDPRYLTPPSPATIAGAVTQQTATIAGSFTTHENEDWLLGLFATEEQLIFA